MYSNHKERSQNFFVEMKHGRFLQLVITEKKIYRHEHTPVDSKMEHIW